MMLWLICQQFRGQKTKSFLVTGGNVSYLSINSIRILLPQCSAECRGKPGSSWTDFSLPVNTIQRSKRRQSNRAINYCNWMFLSSSNWWVLKVCLPVIHQWRKKERSITIFPGLLQHRNSHTVRPHVTTMGDHGRHSLPVLDLGPTPTFAHLSATEWWKLKKCMQVEMSLDSFSVVYQKCHSANRWIFTWSIFLSDLIPSRFETTQP